MVRKLPEPVTKDEFEKLLAVAKHDRDQYWKPRKKEWSPRGKSINEYMIAMILGFGAGMRISEIIGLQYARRYYYVKKDGKVIDTIKRVNIPSLTPERVGRDSIRVVSGKGGKDRVVPKPRLLNEKAIKALPLTIGRRQLQRYVTELGQRVLKKHITFHMLRHGFVTHAIESGMPIGQVQMLAGHSRLDTTGIYLHVNPSKALEKYEEVF